LQEASDRFKPEEKSSGLTKNIISQLHLSYNMKVKPYAKLALSILWLMIVLFGLYLLFAGR
jgi:hypothetical protein